MQEVIDIALNVSLVIHLVLIGFALWRVWYGENAIDRLIAVDLTGTLILAVLVIVTLREQQGLYLDVAMGLAALGFTGTVLLGKYFADQRLS